MSKVFILGGTGFLGYYTALELLRKGYEVKTMALPPMPDDNLFAKDARVEISLGNINELSDEKVIELLSDCDGFMYAAGADERVVPATPALKFYYEANVLPTQRLARLAAAAGVKHFVIYGSYFAEFAERFATKYPELKNQPYPNTRLLQEQVGFAEGEGKMTVTSIRLPYIFGTMPGRMPLWKMFADQIKDKPVYPALKGGTAAVTVEQVAEAAVGAMEHGEHRHTYAISSYFLRYQDFYKMIVNALGQAGTTEVPIIPYAAVQATYEKIDADAAAAGVEHGIHMSTSGRIQEEDLYLDPADTMGVLHINEHDMIASIDKTLAKVVASYK